MLNMPTEIGNLFSRPTLARFSSPAGIDLVNLGDVRAFMLMEDNLYKIAVDARHKRYPIEKHYSDITLNGFQPSPVNNQNIMEQRDPRFGIHFILHHLISCGAKLSFLDVGSFIGDVGIRFGNFFRTIGYGGQVYCFDPTISGDLIPYNIKLNGLENHVYYVPIAISNLSGCVMFSQREGHSDSSRMISNTPVPANTIVESIRLSDFIRTNRIEEAFIKLDTENLESAILNDIRRFLDSTISACAFEYHVHEQERRPLLQDLLNTHLLFDIGYLPNPFCFYEIKSDGFEQFHNRISARKYAYTDVLAISRKMPNLGTLLSFIQNLEKRTEQYCIDDGIQNPPTTPQWTVTVSK